MNVRWPLTRNPATALQRHLDSILMGIFVVGAVLVPMNVAFRCWRTLTGAAPPREAFGPPMSRGGVPLGCC